MSPLESLSKRVTIASLLAITALQLALHPDATWLLRTLAAAALAAGWIAGRESFLHQTWLVAAPLVPALLLSLTGRQGPIVDIVWMAGLTGSVLRGISSSRWSFPRLWAMLLGGWALALSLAWPVMVGRETGFDPGALRDAATINSWAMLSAPQVVAWTLYAVQAQLLGLLWFDWVYSAMSATPDRFPRAVHGLWIGVTISSVVALVQGIGDITFLNTPFWIDRERAVGTMLDANAYCFAAALAGPAGFLAIRGARTPRTAVAIVVLAVNWGGVWMSSSRTGLLFALCGAAGLAAGVLRGRRESRVPQRPMALVAAAAVVALLVAFAGTIGPLRRAAGMPLDEQGLVSLWDREGYGTVALRMVREFPLTGVGVGAYRYLAPDYWRVIDNDQLALDNAQNWWRHQAAELGLLGGAFVLLWSGVIGWRVISGRSRPGHALDTWTTRSLIVGLGACSLFGMPTQNPVVLLLFFLLVAWTDTQFVPAAVGDGSPRWMRAGWIAAVTLAVAYTGAHVVLASGPLSVPQRAQRFHREYVVGAYAPEPLPGANLFRWTDDESRFLLPARTPWLVVRLWAHHPDIRERPVTVTLSPPCGEPFSVRLMSNAAVSVGITLPSGLETFDADVRVSRTWSPAEQGAEDPRQIGAGVTTDFVTDRQLVFSQDYAVEWPKCP